MNNNQRFAKQILPPKKKHDAAFTPIKTPRVTDQPSLLRNVLNKQQQTDPKRFFRSELIPD